MTAGVATQTRLFRHLGERAADQLGESVAFVGDVDRDGHADLAVGSPFRSKAGAWAGGVQVFSGRSGAVLYMLEGAKAGDRFGCGVAGVGDLDADGHADFAVSAPFADSNGTDAGLVVVHSGKTGRLLYRWAGQAAADAFGFAIAGVGDVNGDGAPDLVAGAPYSDKRARDAGSAYVLSGKGGVLRRFDGAGSRDYLGWVVGGGGDVDKDGRPDVLVTAIEPFAGPGRVHVFSGRSGTQLRLLKGGTGDGQFGTSVSDVGDCNKDGYSDIGLGVFGFDHHGSNKGHLKVFSGRDGKLLFEKDGERNWEWFGTSVAPAGDVNRDGHADVLAGPRWGSYVKLYSGKDGALLLRHGEPGVSRFGIAITGGEDVDRDGSPDFAVGAPTSFGNRGSAFVFSARRLPFHSDVHELSLARGGTQLLTLEAGASFAGKSFVVLGTMSGTRPGIRVGAHVLPLNLDAYLIHTTRGGAPLRGAVGTLDSRGAAGAQFVLPTGLPASLVGTVLHHAFGVVGSPSTQVLMTSNPVPLLLTR